MAPRSKKQQEEPQAAVDEDATMQDAPPTSAQPPAEDDEAYGEEDGDGDEDEYAGEGEGEDEQEEEQIRVKLLPGSTPTAASFEFLDEGHTLGNALRYIVMKNPDVEFCAYTIPHPSEAKMNIRIQTWDGTAIQALEKGLKDLQDLCDVVTDKFTAAVAEFTGDR